MAAVTTGAVIGGAALYESRQQRRAADRAAGQQAEGIAQAQDISQENLERAIPMVERGFGDALGSIQAGQQGAQASLLGGLQPALGELSQGFGQAQQTLQPAAMQGAGAGQLQAALSGALGSDQQAQAFQNFQQSPGQQFLQREQEQSLLRNQAALGGGLAPSGRIMEALQQQAMGRAQTDLDAQFARLGQVAGRGDAATQNIANLQAQLGAQRSGIQGGLAQALSGMQMDAGQQMAQLQAGQGTTLGNIMTGHGAQQAQLAQNMGAALAGGNLFRAQQPSPIMQGISQGLGGYMLGGGTLPGMGG